MKKVISILIAVVMLFSAFAITASADENAAGFYNIGENDTMTFAGISSATGEAVEATTVDVNCDGVADTFYADADGVKVTYTGATDGAYYGVILVEDRGLPTVDSKIYYIDQVTAKGNTFDVEVFPKLPAEKKALTLYVSSSEESAALKSVPLNYKVAGAPTADEGAIALGDLDGDGDRTSVDALITLQIGGNIIKDATEAQRKAADVNGDNDINSTDALMILQYGAGLIKNWN